MDEFEPMFNDSPNLGYNRDRSEHDHSALIGRKVDNMDTPRLRRGKRDNWATIKPGGTRENGGKQVDLYGKSYSKSDYMSRTMKSPRSSNTEIVNHPYPRMQKFNLDISYKDECRRLQLDYTSLLEELKKTKTVLRQHEEEMNLEANQTIKFEQELSREKLRVTELEGELKNLKMNGVLELQGKLKRRDATIIDLQEQMRQMSTERVLELQGKLERQGQEIIDLQEQLRQRSTERIKLEANQTLKFDQELSKEKSKVKELEGELRNMKMTGVLELQGKLKRRDARIFDLQEQLRQKSTERIKLEANQILKFDQELSKEKTRVKELEGELRNLEMSGHKMKKMETELKELKELHTAHEIEKYDFRRQIRDAHNQAAKTDKENTALSQEINRMKNAIEKLNQRGKNNDGYQLGANIQQLEKQVREKDEQIRRLQEETSNFEKKSNQLLEDIFESNRTRDTRGDSNMHKMYQEKCEEIKTLKEKNDCIIREKDRTIAELTESNRTRDTRGDSNMHKMYQEKCEEIKTLKEKNDCIIREKDRTIAELTERRAVKDDDPGKDVTALWEQILSLNAELSVSKASEKKYLDDNSRLRNKYREMHEDKQNLCRNHESIGKEKDRRIAELTERLSMEMETKVSADESALENICMKTRPTTIANDYELLCSNEWLEAKQSLDERRISMSEDDKLQLLCQILEIGLEVCNRFQQQSIDYLRKAIQTPGVTENLPSRGGQVTRLSPNVENALMNVVRLNSEHADMTVITQKINDAVEERTKASYKPSRRIQKYMKAVGQITWKMSIQRPPMTLDMSGVGQIWKGPSRQAVFWTSSDPASEKSRVKYYVHPAMYHGSILMVKGRVMLQDDY